MGGTSFAMKGGGNPRDEAQADSAADTASRQRMRNRFTA